MKKFLIFLFIFSLNINGIFANYVSTEIDLIYLDKINFAITKLSAEKVENLKELVNKEISLTVSGTRKNYYLENILKQIENLNDSEETENNNFVFVLEGPEYEGKIKGNVNSKKQKIYHYPGCKDYNKVKIKPSEGDMYFNTREEAESAGFRVAENC